MFIWFWKTASKKNFINSSGKYSRRKRGPGKAMNSPKSPVQLHWLIA